MRNRSPAKIAASSPPVPARTSRKMLLSSCGSFGTSRRCSSSSSAASRGASSLELLLHGEFARGRGVAFERDEAAVAVDERPQPRVFHRQFAELVLPRDDAGIGQQAADFLESLVELLELAPDGVFHGREL